MKDQSKTPNAPSPRVQRTVRAVKSGFRRYPRAILDSITKSQLLHQPFELPKVLDQIAHHELAILWLGHATVIARISDITISVDPVLSERIGMRLWKKTFGIPRISPPPVSPKSLIGTDLLLITHAHFDHLDKPTLEQMKSPATTVIVPPKCSGLIPKGFGRIIELATGSTVNTHNLQITAIEPKHWGARSVFDRKRGVNSYHVQGADQSILFAGDTAYTDIYHEISDVNLAIFGIGAYDPWDHMHATPEQVWSMFKGINAQYILPIHHSTYELSDEPIDEPLERLYCAAGDEQDKIINPIIGEVVAWNPPQAT